MLGYIEIFCITKLIPFYSAHLLPHTPTNSYNSFICSAVRSPFFRPKIPCRSPANVEPIGLLSCSRLMASSSLHIGVLQSVCCLLLQQVSLHLSAANLWLYSVRRQQEKPSLNKPPFLPLSLALPCLPLNTKQPASQPNTRSVVLPLYLYRKALREGNILLL